MAQFVLPIQVCPVGCSSPDHEAVAIRTNFCQLGEGLHVVDPVPNRRGQKVRDAADVDQAR